VQLSDLTQSKTQTIDPKTTEKPTKILSPEDIETKKRLVEASLYVAGYPLELKTLCSITRIFSKRKVQAIARTLAEEYARREGALEVVELEGERFVMQLKSRLVSRVRRLSIKPLLTAGPLKTLSYIAYRQPVPQAKVVLVRGEQTYEHIGKLLEIGLISREKFGKSHLIRTTSLFADYFSLSGEPRLMRRQLEVLFSEIAKPVKEPEKQNEDDSRQMKNVSNGHT